MRILKNLTDEYSELWKEYQEFLKLYNLTENNVEKVCFIFFEKCLNKGCLKINPNLRYEEQCMYNYSVDDDVNPILVDNDYGSIYVKLKNNKIYGFRCCNHCLKPQTFKFLNIWTEKNMSKNQIVLLKEKDFF